MTLMIDQVLAAAFRENKVASLNSLKSVVQTKEGFKNLDLSRQKEVDDILGLAHLAMLELEEAGYWFLKSGNATLLNSVFEVGVRHGKYVLVKFLMDNGFLMSQDDYFKFLREKALPYLPMYRDEQKGFSIEERVLDMVLGDLGETGEKALAEAVEFMEKGGSLNTVKKFILANYAKNQDLIQRYEGEFNEKAAGGRKRITEIFQEYCRTSGLKFVKALQTGDGDNYFPSVAHIFLVKDRGRKIVFKEDLKLHQDYSKINGYSMEKEILEKVYHENIVKYLDSVKVAGIEFLVLDFMPGVTLQRYVQPNNLLPLPKVVEIIRTLAEILDYLHQNQIIYMDIKDKNVMYDGSQITLFDFGMSQITAKPYITSLLTTPEYTTPEMATTFRAYQQTDIFQLGILFYKMLVGKNPFVRYDLYDFVETEEHRESCIIKFVLPTILRPFDKTPKVLQENPAIYEILTALLQKDYQKRPDSREVIERLGRL